MREADLCMSWQTYSDSTDLAPVCASNGVSEHCEASYLARMQARVGALGMARHGGFVWNCLGVPWPLLAQTSIATAQESGQLRWSVSSLDNYISSSRPFSVAERSIELLRSFAVRGRAASGPPAPKLAPPGRTHGGTECGRCGVRGGARSHIWMKCPELRSSLGV